MDFSVKTFVVGPVGTNCYVLKDNASNEGIVIDPGDDPQKILSYIGGENIDIKLLVLTHGHFDHIGAVEELRNSLKVPVAVHAADAPMITDGRLNLSAFVGGLVETQPADIILHEGDNISFGKCSLRVISTPGHTNGGICLHGGGALFSGDTLFCGSYGRVDFPTSSARSMEDSVFRLVHELPEDVSVYPGHDMFTSISFEKRYNPLAH